MSLGFAAPLFLVALLALPALWWLLRLTPPKPRTEVFPPLRLLLKLAQKDETPAKSPWWLLLLRLLVAALVIAALAQPVWKSGGRLIAGRQPLALVIDNGWAAAAQWPAQVRAAQALVRAAEENNLPLSVIATAEAANGHTAPVTAQAARMWLDSLRPRPNHVDRKAAFASLAALARTVPGLQVAYLTDGLATAADDAAFGRLAGMGLSSLLWYPGDVSSLVALSHAENTADKLIISGVRAETATTAAWPVTAHDLAGRRLGETRLQFAQGAKHARAEMSLPLEIRNDVASLQIEGGHNAGAIWLNSSSNRRRRIAILAPATAELAQPLLSPLYYVSKALAPYGNIMHAPPGTLTQSIAALLAARPAVLVMGDVSSIPAQASRTLADWIQAGGTLIRFAGPHLAASAAQDTLVPVTLRRGERALGGAMSWASPQKIAPFPGTSPFAGLTPPDDVTVSRQILAEPSATLYERSWVTLADGTPLVTAATQGKGRIVFIHTAAGPGWSNLPLSGFFVEMLQRIITTANQPVTATTAQAKQTLAPWRSITAQGGLETPPHDARPLVIQAGQQPLPSLANPPGFYGSAQSLYGLNLLDGDTVVAGLQKPGSLPVTELYYARGDTVALQGPLMLLAILLFTLDSLVALRLKGVWRGGSIMGAKSVTAVLALAVVCLAAQEQISHAEESKNAPPPENTMTAQESTAPSLAGKTHLAYVITHDAEIDKISKAGLESLTQFISQRTTISPGDVIGVDPEQDELAFYPLLYWPIDAASPKPSGKALERIDAYMRYGGTILFDTRDQMTAHLRLDNGPSPATQYLREILAGLNIPPLEPAPPEHVIARSFYIVPDFPGRYRGSPLWIASASRTGDNRPILAGDGVSPILITANDMAGAWAHDGAGNWLFPVVPDDNRQRVWAFRCGLNIVMYMLSGNYKADQVHAPELLKRLGR